MAEVWHWQPSELDALTADDLLFWLEARAELDKERKREKGG